MRASAVLEVVPLMGILFVGGCASPIPPAQPAAMVPRVLKGSIPTEASIYIEKPTLDSAAKDGKAPYDEITGKLPFVQPQGLTNYQESVRLTLAAVGAQPTAERERAAYVLRPVILGGMAIPFPEAYSVLFVHYQFEDARMGTILWRKNIYSQAKLEKVRSEMGSNTTQDPAYGRLVAANLRQMVDSLSAWFAEKHD
jgi:hypothetical protein